MEQLNELTQEWLHAKEKEKEVATKRKTLEQEIQKLMQSEIEKQLDDNYRTGTATLDALDGKLTLSYPKKVKWDNEVLAGIWSRIEQAGENPQDYIVRTLEVSETKYKNLPPAYRKIFQPARTVSAGNPTFSYKE